MDLMFAPLRRYAEFNGRSRRAEYWLFTLLLGIVYTVLIVLAAATGGVSAEGEAGPGGLFVMAAGVMFLAVLIPSLAVAVRRMHDINMSGWWLLLGLVPFGGLVTFVFSVLPGTTGPNRFGEDPKGPAGDAQQAAIVFS